MKLVLLWVLMLTLLESQAQQKGDNEIKIHGVTFDQVIHHLIDNGFQIDVIDSNYKTAFTLPRNASQNGRMSTCYMSIFVRVEDTTAVLKGKFYNKLFVKHTPASEDYSDVSYAWPGRWLFDDLNNFALSLKGHRYEYRNDNRY